MMAYLLVFMSFFFQGLLIYTIGNQVVANNVKWRDGILKSDSALNLVGDSGGQQCNDGGSLCFKNGDIYSCAPPSVQLTGRWEELDENGDGIWARGEVEKRRDELKCSYAVDPVEVFDVFHKFLLERRSLIWLHPDVVAGKAIHKPYFEYAMGDIIMCGYRNTDMCSNLLQRGVFDSPLAYCRDLLRSGGTCEMALPSTYATWRIDSAQQCGKKEYEKFVYTHPSANVSRSLLSVDYRTRQDFERSKTTIFFLFKGIIIFLWLMAMTYELKNIIIVLTWVCRFPDAAQFGDNPVTETVDEADPEKIKYTISGITSSHRLAVGILNLGRLAMTIVLTYVGVSFLAKQTSYTNLLLDGVALLFIVEIANMLYVQVLRSEIRAQTEDIEPMVVDMYGIDWLNRRPALTDFVWLLGCSIVVVAVMYTFYTDISVPVSEALECTCLSRGDRCFEAEQFSTEFWRKYWLKDVPRIIKEVNAMKGGVAFHVESAAAGLTSAAAGADIHRSLVHFAAIKASATSPTGA